MKKIFSLLIFALCCANIAFATHNRAGEITFVHVSGYTYEITVTTITYSPSAADRYELEVNFGDGNSDVVSRVNGPAGTNPAGVYCAHLGENISGYDDVKLNKYTTTHTYAGTGTFIISVEDPNRNYGVINIPNSVNVPFYIETMLYINPFMGSNDSPQTTLLPVDKACVGVPFITNAGAYDLDGDSLSYELIICRGESGLEIPGYTYPTASHSFYIDEITGDLFWISPTIQGEYNVAYKIKEWRNGVQIGYIIRDFQILVLACDNNPPNIEAADTCAVIGERLEYPFVVTDGDYDAVTVQVSGEPFVLENAPATYEVLESSEGLLTGRVLWEPSCYEARKSPYVVYFKATETGNTVNLSSVNSANIYVYAPAPQNPGGDALSGNVYLNWDIYCCNNAKGFYIYRTRYEDNHIQGQCESGMPDEWNYERISVVEGSGVTSFTDYGETSGLVPGVKYYYRISAYFDDEVESKISDKVVVTLKKDVPVITHVSVQKTDAEQGEMTITLSPPTEIDEVLYPGPYKYFLYRYDEKEEIYVEIDSTDNLLDSVFYDFHLNTKDIRYRYYFGLYNYSNGIREYMGKSSSATSLFLVTSSGDEKITLSWSSEVPWLLDSFDIYRKFETGDFEKIANVTDGTYIDGGLENYNEYCYMVASLGHYSAGGYADPLVNFSQSRCDIPADNEAPCVSELTVFPDCDEMTNHLTWTNPESSGCCDDVAGYYIYFQSDAQSGFAILDSLMGNEYDTSYLHYNEGIMFGCYYITSVDDSGNVSEASNVVCLYGDECTNYILPNIFTPNGDSFNDVFKPKSYSGILSVETYIYNRQGRLVFHSDDIEINWDGRDYLSHQNVSDGVYFYVCTVTMARYDGSTGEKILSGYVHIIR